MRPTSLLLHHSGRGYCAALMGSARLHRWIERHGAVLALVLTILAGLLGLFNRSLNYHDEIINTQKALEPVVVDYAMRPVFYGLNVVALQVFGNHTYALVILSVLTLGMTGLCLYYICARYLSPSVGLFCVFVFVCTNMLRESGVRAMAHVHAGMFMMLSLACALASFTATTPRTQRYLGFAAGLLAIASFSTHPSLAGYLVALCSFAAITWFLSLSRYTASSPLASSMRPALWMAIGIATALALLMLAYSLWFPQPYFKAWIHFAKIPQGTESNRGISLFYIETLIRKTALPSTLLLVSLLIVAARRFTGGGSATEGKESKTRAFVLAMSLYCLVVGAGMVTLNQWKYQRLLVSYLPLVALSFAVWSNCASEAITAWLPPKWARVLVLTALVFVGVRSVGGVYRAARVQATDAHGLRFKYLSLYEALRNVPDPKIGVLAGRGKLGTKASFVYAAGLDFAQMPYPDEFAEMASPEALASYLMDEQVRYLYWDLSSTSADEYRDIAAKLRAIGGGVVLNWRGLRELWLVQITSGDFAHSLAALEPATKVAIFGEDGELARGTAYEMRILLESYHLRPYTLNVNKRTPRRQLYYLTRNKADYLLLPAAADNQISEASIAAMEATLRDVGATMVEEDGNPKLRLWHITDRARAAANAEN